jgi:hypothetical protein
MTTRNLIGSKCGNMMAVLWRFLQHVSFICAFIWLYSYIKPACRLPVDVGSCQCVQVVPGAPRSNPLVDYLPLQYPAPYNHGQSWHYVLLFPEDPRDNYSVFGCSYGRCGTRLDGHQGDDRSACLSVVVDCAGYIFEIIVVSIAECAHIKESN